MSLLAFALLALIGCEYVASQNTASVAYSGVSAGVSTLTVADAGYSLASAQVISVGAAVPAVFFGLTVLNFGNLTPSMVFGTTRSWDAYPDLDWSDANPSAGAYNFTSLDNFIARNHARGAEMIYTFGRTPQWASSQPNAPGPYGPGQCAPPAGMSAWDNYVRAVVIHAAGRIKYWELWNEPNAPEFYCGDIPTMVTLAQHAAQIIKGIDPSALIVSPAVTFTSGPAWLAAFLSEGGVAYVDIIAFHGYRSARAEDIVNVIAKYKTVMTANGAAGKPLWDTESSWSGDGNIGTPGGAEQVGFVAKDYLLHWSEGVLRFVWYAYDGGSIWGGLWNAAAGESAAAVAYRETYSWMVGATLRGPCSANQSGIWICALSRPGGYTAEAVWISGKTASFQVPPRYTTYRDLAGGMHRIANHTVTVCDQPILLESAVP